MHTTSALTAKAIKKELTAKYPNIKFSVRSDNFSMGNSVDVSYKNGVPQEEIEKITRKYQYGHFNGMIDCYEMSNCRKDIPQAKFISVSRKIDKEILEAKKQEIAKEFGIDKPEDESEWMRVFNQWPQQVVYKELADKVL